MGYAMSAVSPMGSNESSPLRSYTSHGNGLSANYGQPDARYDTGGAIRAHNLILPGSDFASKTSGLYSPASRQLGADNNSFSASFQDFKESYLLKRYLPNL